MKQTTKKNTTHNATQTTASPEPAKSVRRRSAYVEGYQFSFRELLESSADMIALLDMEDRYIYVTPSSYTLFGQKPEDMIGKSANDYIHPEDVNYYYQATMLELGQKGDVRYRRLKQDGSYLWVETTCRLVADRHTGQPAYLLAIVRDISQRKQAEDALRESEARFRSVFEMGTVGMAILTTDNRWHDVNDRLCDILGYSREELANLEWSQITHPNDLGDEQDIMKQASQGRINSFSHEKRYIRKNGEVIYAHVWVRCIRRPDGSIAHYLAIVEDITQTRMTQQAVINALEKEQSRLGQDLHDGLIQQLSGILFMAQLLEKRLAQHAPQDVQQLKEINRLLGQSVDHARRLARGLYPVELEAGGIMSVLQELSESVEELYGIPCFFEYDFSPQVEKQNVTAGAEADTHLYRIAQEAINNAIRHGQPSQVTLRFKVKDRDFELEIEDNGKGVGKNLEKSKGIGLRSMKYRAKILGAKLEILPRSRGGTIVRCCLRSEQAHSEGRTQKL